MFRKPKLIIFDMDGTLSESRELIAPEMSVSLARLLEQAPVAIMTGGDLEDIQKQVISTLPINVELKGLFLFPLSATQSYTWENGDWHLQYDHSFSENESAEIRSAITKALEIVAYPKPPHIWGEQVKDHKTQITFRALGYTAPLDDRQMWARMHGPARFALWKVISELLPNYSVTTGGIVSIDITKKNINKRYGVERLHEQTGIAIENMLFVGDGLEEGGNDAVVIETGIPIYKTANPSETRALIERITAA